MKNIKRRKIICVLSWITLGIYSYLYAKHPDKLNKLLVVLYAANAALSTVNYYDAKHEKE